MTQSRFIKLFRNEQKKSSLFQRKIYGSSYLIHVPTINHGCFTSYAIMGIENPVAGYWGQVEKQLKTFHHEICNNVLLFLNGYLKQDQTAKSKLAKKAENADTSPEPFKIEYKPGKTPPPLQAALINAIVEKGLKDVKPEIQTLKKIYPSPDLFNESVLNWLGYHFLYWWGREDEAIAVFELNVQLFPDSGNAFDSLGEAYLRKGDKQKAIASYKKSIELNPENNNAKGILKQLELENNQQK
jgi:tetratricopeptide (TPR) repeat protein